MEYDFSIQYKKGKENLVADVLSRMEDVEGQQEGMLAMISFPKPDQLEELKAAYELSTELSKLKKNMLVGQHYLGPYKLQQGLLLRKKGW